MRSGRRAAARERQKTAAAPEVRPMCLENKSTLFLLDSCWTCSLYRTSYKMIQLSLPLGFTNCKKKKKEYEKLVIYEVFFNCYCFINWGQWQSKGQRRKLVTIESLVKFPRLARSEWGKTILFHSVYFIDQLNVYLC